MKKIVTTLLIYCFVLNLGIYGQSLEKYESFDIKNTSGQVFGLISSEYSSNENFKNLINQKNQEYLPNIAATDSYIAETNKIIESTKNKQERNLLLITARNELINYGVDVATNYAQILPSKFATNFITPAIQRGVEFFSNKSIENEIEIDKANINEIIKSRVNLLYTKNKELDLASQLDTLDINKTSDVNKFASMFALSQTDIPALSSEENSVLNKELLKYAFGFIKTNREEIKELRTLVNERLSQQTSEQTDAEFNNLKTDYTNKISTTEKRITEKVEKDFAEIGSAINNLTKNQTVIFDNLNKIQGEVSKNKEDIKNLEIEMSTVKTNISNLRKDVTNLQQNVSIIESNVIKLNEIQNKHSILIKENSIKIDILAKYTFQNLKPTQQLEALKDKNSIFSKGLSETKRTELVEKLQKIVDTEGIVDVSNKIATYSNIANESVLPVLVERGVIKGEDAKKASKFLHYLIATSQIVGGAARVYAGDYTGAISVVQGLSSLMGGTKKPQPSPEFKMLQAVYKKLEQIELQIRDIKDTIVKFRNDVIEMYKSLSNSLQIIADRLDKIDWKIDELRNVAGEILFKEYSACLSDYNARKNTQLVNYNDYVKLYTTETGYCLKALAEFTRSETNVVFHLGSLAPSGDPNRVREYEIREVFNPTKDLLKKIYPIEGNSENKDKFSRINLSLMLPVTTTYKTDEAFQKLETLNLSISASDISFYEDYLNYEFLIQFSEFFITYSPYFEIAQSDPFFKPEILDNFLQKTADQHLIAKNAQNNRLKKLIQLTEQSIAQQSLISGNAVLETAYLTFKDTNDREKTLLLNKVLRNNKLFSYNFATYLLHKNLRVSENENRLKEFKAVVDKIKTNRKVTDEQISVLNKFMLLNIPEANFIFKFKEEDKKLYLSYTKENETVDMIIPETDVILENRMINSEAIPRLIKLRELLNEKLLDQNFTENISNENQTIFNREKYKYILSSAYLN